MKDVLPGVIIASAIAGAASARAAPREGQKPLVREMSTDLDDTEDDASRIYPWFL